MQPLRSALPLNLAILDRAGAIRSVDEGWKRFARENGLRTPRFGLGSNYFAHCKGADPETRKAVAQIRSLVDGEVDLVSFVYRCDSPREKRTFVLIGAALPGAPDSDVALLHLNVSAMMLGSHSAQDVAGLVETSAAHGLSVHLARMSLPRMIVNGGAAPLLARAEWGLTEKEQEVLRLLAKGKTNKEMAALLSRSPNTIKIHVSSVLKKLKLRSRTEAALFGWMSKAD